LVKRHLSQQVTAWIPIFGKYKSEAEGFPSHALTATYQYPAGKHFSFAKVDTSAGGSWVKR
jgi:hypothetical protein